MAFERELQPHRNQTAIAGARRSVNRTEGLPRGPLSLHLLALQRAAGNRAVSGLLHPVQRLPETTAYDAKKRNAHEYLRLILDGLDCLIWEFPTQTSGDGCIGVNTISKGAVFQVMGSKHGLLYHVNFMITPGTMTKSKLAAKGRVVLNLGLLHLTARSTATQATINQNNPSILTAGDSIHCGPNNDWDWSDPHVQNLADKLGVEVSTLKSSIQTSGLNKNYMSRLATKLMACITGTVNRHLPNVDVELNGDTTWTGR